MNEFFLSETLYSIIPILLATGAFAGVLAGLLGVGGGIVIVPVLFLLADRLGVPAELAMHMAVGTSLATIIPTSISSAISHNKKEAVDHETFKAWTPFIIAGAIIGSIIAKYFDATTLKNIFGVFALFVAINMLLGKRLALKEKVTPTLGTKIFAGTVIGGFSSLMGIGGGTLSVPILSMHSFPVHKAVGTSAAFGILIAIAGTLGFIWSGWTIEGRPPFSLGYVNTLAAIIIFSVSIFCAPIGTKISHWLNPKHMRLVFGIFLALSAAKMLLS